MNSPYTKHPRFYQDQKYYLIRVDPLNYALVNKTRYEKYGINEGSLYGYYPTLKQAIEELLQRKTSDLLLQKIREEGPFKTLDSLVTTYIENALTTSDNAIKMMKIKE